MTEITKQLFFDFGLFYDAFLLVLENQQENKRLQIMTAIVGNEQKISEPSLYKYASGAQQFSKEVKKKYDKASVCKELLESFIELSGEQKEKVYKNLEDRLTNFKELYRRHEFTGRTPLDAQKLSEILNKSDNFLVIISELMFLAINTELKSSQANTKDSKDRFEVELKKPVDSMPFIGVPNFGLTERIGKYSGYYMIYYYSQHYPNEIHTGILNIYESDNQGYLEARMLFGVNDMCKLADIEIKKIMEAKTHGEAFKLYSDYRDCHQSRYDRRFYLYRGIVEATDSFIMIHMAGTGKREEHRLVLFINVARIGQHPFDEHEGYKGGLALAITLPNKSNQKIRSFKMGISSIALDVQDQSLKDLLELSITERQRIQVQRDDDTEFYDYLLKCEHEQLMQEKLRDK